MSAFLAGSQLGPERRSGKRFLLAALAVPLVLLAASPAMAGPTAPSRAALSPTLVGKVVAYATTNGSNTGPKQTFGPGVYRANAGELSGVGNDATRLLEVGPSMRVRACHHDNIQTGNTCQSFENLGATNRTFAVGTGISQLEVRTLVVGYRDPSFGGVAQGFEIGRYEVANGDFSSVGNDTISSLRIAPGLSLRLCTDNPENTTGGSCGAFSSSTSALSSSLDNGASWLEIRPVTVAHRDNELSGIGQRFGAGIFTAPQLTVVGNDTISSLLVNEGVSTRICSDDPNNTTGGSCGTFAKSPLGLSASLDNRTSWIANSHNVILQPRNDVTNGNDQVTLRGYAIDPEDGALTGVRLRWSSSRDGFLGTGNVLPVTLSASTCGPGGARQAEHVISLVATDSAGNQTRTERLYKIDILC